MNESACEGCGYWYGWRVPCCNYIFHNDKKRPCPPGEQCTERTEEEIQHIVYNRP